MTLCLRCGSSAHHTIHGSDPCPVVIQGVAFTQPPSDYRDDVAEIHRLIDRLEAMDAKLDLALAILAFAASGKNQ